MKLWYSKLNVLALIAGIMVSAVEAAPALSSFNFMGASVLPYTRWQAKPKGQAYFLLSREAGGRDKGTYDAFGGSRDPGENHPVETASRECAEESAFVLGSPHQLKKHIDVNSGNTHTVVAQVNKRFAVYVTKFHPRSLETLTKRFYSARSKARKWSSKEKDKLAWVRWTDLEHTVANARRDSNNRIIAPIYVAAQVVEPNGKKHKAYIPLRPVFVSSMQSFFKGTHNYTLGKSPKIRFYPY